MRTIANALNKLLVGAAAVSALTLSNAAETPWRFPHPDRIRYDSHCLTINGKDILIYSGAFHYFRCPKELWRDRFIKIKQAGFNTVETYVPWNWSEREKPARLDDFSKVNLDDLDEWLDMAEEYGLYVIVRPGPYICAEWDTGGFPQWLVAQKPAGYQGEWLRSDNPTFLAWSKHWYAAVCPVIAKHQVTQRSKGQPGVILFQIENEYDYAKFPDEVKIHHLKTLAQAARADGIDVPLFTCWTSQVRGSKDAFLYDVFDTCNFYPRWNVDGELNSNIPKLRAEQPDAPLMTTELQGGWFSEVGGKLSEDQDGLTAAQINNMTLLALSYGETSLNYYMLFGGSNFGDWAARKITTTYDYNAPIREPGGVGDRYQCVWAIGHMLRDHGARLARAEKVDCKVSLEETTGKKKDVTVVMRRASDGSRYLFVRTSQRTQPRAGVAHVTPATGSDTQEIVFNYDLEPFGSKILYLPPGVNDAAKGEWLPKAAPDFQRPTNLPPAVEITSARWHVDPGPPQWTKMQPGQSLAKMGVYDSDFVFYKSTMNESLKTNLVISHPAKDTVIATLSGTRVPAVGGMGSNTMFVVPTGFNSVMFLYENLGHANGGLAMENPCGLFDAQLIALPKYTKSVGVWRMQEVSTTEPGNEIRRDFVDDDWPVVPPNKLQDNSLAAGHTAVYRTTIALADDDFDFGKLNLNFDRIDDLGWVYVNGTLVGQTSDNSRKYSFDITTELQPGVNVVALLVHNNEGNGGITAATLESDPEIRAVHLEAFGKPAGIQEGWWTPSFKDKQWDSVNLGPSSAAPDTAMLTWYRMNFKMPSAKSHVWVPWRLHLNANGNGFLYLNGHPLGRYWQAGPQHDFFLPECWLNFGKENLVALSLRPLDQGVSIQSATVEPYAEFAEKR